ncbi:hypothetical protein GCM10011529_04400 [Polymorphobacter glacialis]|uniref:Ice-binding protein C-terminal domain-containing protein n=2 Tax=Sandarakinorhabdus glacialis TaxID=1614636 RepID=A0A916ZK67_9SPHN|nr:hypothetical protein GCM10011529_04400 [Polymorphobacter glacialis]
MIDRFSLLAAVTLAVATFAAPASAVSLTGLTVQVAHEFPELGSFDFGPANYTVGTTAPLSYYGLADISVGATTFTINVFCGARCTWSPADFNGFVLFDTYSVASPFSVSINSATSYAGFDASRISFDDNTVRVNLAGLDANGLIVINVAGSVPEPRSWAMLIAGFGLVGAAMRKRSKATLAA